jgi:uncharacterized protein YjbI with pentapeptide repeats
MANDEHLTILGKGVKAWNTWRAENPDVLPVLSQANLFGLDLAKVNFSDADLEGGNLIEANLSKANLNNAILKRANLSEANIRSADLERANLDKAILRNANLCEANLRNANLCEANLRDADLSMAKLYAANLAMANLSWGNLSKANLFRVDLSGANLQGANLKSTDMREANLFQSSLVRANLHLAKLRRADLRSANLSKANLQQADLRGARLITSNADKANISAAKIWEIQISEWSIKGIICESVYWDKDAKILTKYEPGEFERLHSEKPFLRLNYEGGITAIEIATLPGMITKLASEHPGCVLRLKSINQGPGGATVEIAVDEAGGVEYEQLKRESEKMQVSQREVLGKMDGLACLFKETEKRLIEAFHEHALKTDLVSMDISDVKQRIEELSRSEDVSQEKLEEIAKQISSMPSENQQNVIDFLMNVAGGTWTSVLLKAIERFAT